MSLNTRNNCRGTLQAFDSTPSLNPEYTDAIMDDLLNSKIADKLILTSRSFHCLRNYRVIYLRDLIKLTEVEVLHIPNLGKKCLGEISLELSKLGLSLKGS